MGLATAIIAVVVILANDLTFEEFILKKLQKILSNLKTKYDHLYVCDCSVIPEAWGLPPTSTIIALGKRLAKYLLAEKHIPGVQQRETPVTNELDQQILVH